MKIKKINRIKDYRIFRDFSWSSTSLPEFVDYNLIYGWNGSGKTVLSNIFRDLEHKRISVSDSTFDIEMENGTIRSENLGTLPSTVAIRVFTR